MVVYSLRMMNHVKSIIRLASRVEPILTFVFTYVPGYPLLLTPPKSGPGSLQQGARVRLP